MLQARLSRRAAAAVAFAGDDTRHRAARRSLVGLWLALLVDGVGEETRRKVLAAALGLAASAMLPWYTQVLFDRCSDGSATGSASRWRRMSRRCRRPSRRSPTRSGASTSTGSRCCRARPSVSTTCSCRCSRRSAGCSGWPSSMVLLATQVHPALARAPGLRGPDRGVGDRAARRRAGGAGAGGAAPPARAQHVPARHHPRAGQGGPGHRQRRPPGRERRRARVAGLVRADGAAALGDVLVARPGVGGVRHRLRRRHRAHGGRARRDARPGRAGAGGRQPALAVGRRGGG